MLLDKETIIVIDIQAPNQLEILTCIRETFDYMPNWIVGSSVHTSPTDARFYCFNLTTHVFSWYRQNDTYSDTMDEDEIVIKDLADISHLLEFVYLNSEELRKVYSKPVDPPKKRKDKDEPSLGKMKKKFSKIVGELPTTGYVGKSMYYDYPYGPSPYDYPYGPSPYNGKSKYYTNWEIPSQNHAKVNPSYSWSEFEKAAKEYESQIKAGVDY